MIKIDSLLNKFVNYFSETTSYIYDYENGIRIGDSDTGVYLNLNFSSLFEEFCDSQGNIEELKKILKDNWEIDKLFYSISNSNLFLKNNNDLIIWGNNHSSFKDRWIQGFFKDNYSEFLRKLETLPC